ncbi:MAG: DUF4962 domain-containing protein [Spirochaetia bacterium]|nr:DUF4962 domain-containing protein [Spirochaetia bacterium]
MTYDPLDFPHPHLDPRQPRNGTFPKTNPPVFVGAEIKGIENHRLRIATGSDFKNLVLEKDCGREALFLPETAFDPGKYFWKWSSEAGESEIFSFVIEPDSLRLEVPPAGEWLRRMGTEHPRLYFRKSEVETFRASRFAERKEKWRLLKKDTDLLLKEKHHLFEPPYLPDRATELEANAKAFYEALRDSRNFMIGANTLALAYAASGEKKYARAACERLASISLWDPEGSTHLEHQDETHMSVIWHGPQTCDWVWEHFTDEERERVICQYRRRGQITFEHMHDKGCYGISRFDSHAGREIVFLAQLAFCFHEHIPEAETWLTWLRPVLAGIWPIWSGDDGAWAEGILYASAYVDIMAMFVLSLRRGTGVDLFQKPFWKNHLSWREAVIPTYAEWIGFGDGTEPQRAIWRMSADLVELVSRECQTTEHDRFVSELRKEGERLGPGVEDEWYFKNISPFSYLVGDEKNTVSQKAAPHSAHQLTLFPDGGWAVIRTDKSESKNDLAFLFRASPYGNFSHSHAANGDFVLHAGGEALLQPSGHYDGYATNHHTSYVWHSRSHNVPTFSEAGQLLRSEAARGAVVDPFENEDFIFFSGKADESYAHFLTSFRRNVLYFKKEKAFLLIDEAVSRPGIHSQYQWNLHSFGKFRVDETNRRFSLKRKQASLEGHVLYENAGFFHTSEGFDSPVLRNRKANLRFW